MTWQDDHIAGTSDYPADDVKELDPWADPAYERTETLCCGQCGPRGCGDIEPFQQDEC